MIESCLMCEGQLGVIGVLGNRLHLRCVNCGPAQSTTEFDPTELEVFGEDESLTVKISGQKLKLELTNNENCDDVLDSIVDNFVEKLEEIVKTGMGEQIYFH